MNPSIPTTAQATPQATAKATSPAITGAIDHDQLIERMMGSAQMAQRMLDRFVEASEADCDELESLIRLGNASAITSLAHRHKGTARTMAAPRVASLASEIEQRAETDPTSDLLALVRQLRESHQEVRLVAAIGFEGSRPQLQGE